MRGIPSFGGTTKFELADGRHTSWALALALVALATLGACGSKSAGDDVPAADASTGGGATGGGSTGGNGGSAGGGGHGGDAQSGGSSGGGGAATDAASVACRDDGGMGLASAARHCVADVECQVLIGPTCCGADNAFGIAKAEAPAYASCVAVSPNACQGLGCAKFIGYAVDTGEMTVFGGAMSNPMSQVAVHCKNSLCTTNVVARDAGSD